MKLPAPPFAAPDSPRKSGSRRPRFETADQCSWRTLLDQHQKRRRAARHAQRPDHLRASGRVPAQALLPLIQAPVRLGKNPKLFLQPRPPKLAEHLFKRLPVRFGQHAVTRRSARLAHEKLDELRVGAVFHSLPAQVQQPRQLPLLARRAQIHPREQRGQRKPLIANDVVHPQNTAAHRLNPPNAPRLAVRHRKPDCAERNHGHHRRVPHLSHPP